MAMIHFDSHRAVHFAEIPNSDKLHWWVTVDGDRRDEGKCDSVNHGHEMAWRALHRMILVRTEPGIHSAKYQRFVGRDSRYWGPWPNTSMGPAGFQLVLHDWLSSLDDVMLGELRELRGVRCGHYSTCTVLGPLHHMQRLVTHEIDGQREYIARHLIKARDAYHLHQRLQVENVNHLIPKLVFTDLV